MQLGPHSGTLAYAYLHAPEMVTEATINGSAPVPIALRASARFTLAVTCSSVLVLADSVPASSLFDVWGAFRVLNLLPASEATTTTRPSSSSRSPTAMPTNSPWRPTSAVSNFSRGEIGTGANSVPKGGGRGRRRKEEEERGDKGLYLLRVFPFLFPFPFSFFFFFFLSFESEITQLTQYLLLLGFARLSWRLMAATQSWPPAIRKCFADVLPFSYVLLLQ
jgi:hypothetical protein